MGLISRCNFEWLQPRGYAINPFIGCAHGCLYCWARTWSGIPYEEWVKPKLKPQLQGIPISVEITRAAPRKSNLLLSATTDIFQPDFVGYDSIVECILRGLLWGMRTKELQVWVLTKSGSGIARFLGRLADIRAKVGITLTSLAQNDYEPDSDPPGIRIGALGLAKERRLETFISIEPWIKGTTQPREIIERTRGIADWWILGSHNFRMRPKDPDFYREELPMLLSWAKAVDIKLFVKKELMALVEGASASNPA